MTLPAALLEPLGSSTEVLTPDLASRFPCPNRAGCVHARQPLRSHGLGVLRASKQLCLEGSQVLYGHWTFTTVAGPAMCACGDHAFAPHVWAGPRALDELHRLQGWLKAIGPRNRGFLRCLKLDFGCAIQAKGAMMNHSLNFTDTLAAIAELLSEGGSGKGLQRLELRFDFANLQAEYSLSSVTLNVLGLGLRNVRRVVINGLVVEEELGREERGEGARLPRTALDAGQKMMRTSKGYAPDAWARFRTQTASDRTTWAAIQAARANADAGFPKTLAEMDAGPLGAVFTDVVTNLGQAVQTHGQAAAVEACEQLWHHPDVPQATLTSMREWLSQVPGWTDGALTGRRQRLRWREQRQRGGWILYRAFQLSSY